jgi:hypothetical protein
MPAGRPKLYGEEHKRCLRSYEMAVKRAGESLTLEQFCEFKNGWTTETVHRLMRNKAFKARWFILAKRADPKAAVVAVPKGKRDAFIKYLRRDQDRVKAAKDAGFVSWRVAERLLETDRDFRSSFDEVMDEWQAKVNDAAWRSAMEGNLGAIKLVGTKVNDQAADPNEVDVSPEAMAAAERQLEEEMGEAN